VLVFEVDEQFQHEIVEEEAGHFQVVDGQVALGVGPGNEPSLDIGGPFEAPDNGLNVLVPADPHATGSALAGVAKTDVGG
jgi:hypothetical protein